MDNFDFLPQVVLRTPFFSYEDYDPESRDLLENRYFLVALLLASADLFSIIESHNFNWEYLTDKQKNTVLRYYNRMSFRTTPFGSFSAFCYTAWTENPTDLEISPPEHRNIYLVPDQQLAEQLAKEMSKNYESNYYLKLNPTIYKINRNIRFYQSIIEDNGKRSFSLKSVTVDAVLTDLLRILYKKQLINTSELIHCIANASQCTTSEAKEYLDTLKQAQLITSVSDVNIVGEDYLTRFLQHPSLANDDSARDLQSLLGRMKHLPPNDLNALRTISYDLERLSKSDPSRKIRHLFYSNTQTKTLSGGLNIRYQDQLMDGLKCLNMLVPNGQQNLMTKFKEAFKKRYDLQKIPLLQALDPEAGIPYGIDTLVHSALLEKVDFSSPEVRDQTILWTDVHRLLFKKWPGSEKDHVIEIDENDLKILPEQKLSPPASFPVIFRVTDEAIHIENAGGVTGTAINGRFTILSSEGLILSRQLAACEQQVNPDVIFAEIGQLSNQHTDNINRRLNIYDYEIPLNSVSLLPKEKQIELRDLSLSIIDDEFVLESFRLKKVVHPRLTSAYNYSNSDSVVFRFLCDIQQQGVKSNLSLNLEDLFPGLDFYPRVIFKKIILSLAKWHLSTAEILLLTSLHQKASKNYLTDLRKQRRLPALVALSEADQQLVFNLDKDVDVDLLINCIRGRSTITLQEFLMPGTSLGLRSENRKLIGQFIAFLHKRGATYRNTAVQKEPVNQVKRYFPIGGEWLSLKIYCIPRVADQILSGKLYKFLNEGAIKSLIGNNWFFVRYSDPDYHLRLRMKINNPDIEPLLRRLYEHLNGEIEHQLIHDYQASIYQRELERYGSEHIDNVEAHFSASSILSINFIRFHCHNRLKYPSYSLSFVSTRDLITYFYPDPGDQTVFLKTITESHLQEYRKNRHLKRSLDLKYREIKEDLKLILEDIHFYKNCRLTALHSRFHSASVTITQSIKSSSESKKLKLAADLIHMHLNRLFTDRQREQELIVYYCLHKYITSRNIQLYKYPL